MYYSNVQYAGDENVRRVQRWSIETGQLPGTCEVIDQNQTPSAAHEGGLGQIVRQTLQSQILLWEGRLQGGILTDDITAEATRIAEHVVRQKNNNNTVAEPGCGGGYNS